MLQAELFPLTANVEGERLKLARWLAGVSQRELARRSGLSVRAISSVERGRRGIGPEALAPHLSTSTGFLTRPCPDVQLVDLGQATNERVATKMLAIMIADLRELLVRRSSTSITQAPSPLVTDHSFVAEGSTIRRELGLGNWPIANVIEVAERLGVFVASTGLGSSPPFVSAFTRGGPIIGLTGGASAVNRRWAVACAIGALIAGRGPRRLGTAVRIGGELLLPHDGLKAAHDPSQSMAQNAAVWGAPTSVYTAMADSIGLEAVRVSEGHGQPAGWEQSASLAKSLAATRARGVGLVALAAEFGCEPAVFAALLAGVAIVPV